MHVRFWHKADKPTASEFVRFRGYSGHRNLSPMSANDTQSGHQPVSLVAVEKPYQSTRLSRYDALSGRGANMRRREFIALVGGAAVIWPQVAWAQRKANPVPRIGVLWHAANEEEEAVYLAAVRRGLSDFDYVEGKNIILENRFPAEVPERFISLAAELAALKVDVLVAITRPAALAAQRATATIPIVFVAIPDPIGSKLVASLARPGGNITGLSNFALDLTAKRVEHLKELVPSVSKVALLVNPNDKDGARRYIEEAQAGADKLQVALFPLEVRAPGDLAPAFSKMRDNQINGVVVTQDGLFFRHA